MGRAVERKGELTGADVLVARRRAKVRQADLAAAAEMRPELLLAIEREQAQLVQSEYRRLLDVIEKIAAAGEGSH